ncbi:MAG: elongation factor P, partial [Planctomycetota bacterium]
MKANDLKPGKAINQDGQIWIVTKTEHVKPGKGGAFVQAKIKSMKTGSVQEKRFRSADDVDGVTLDRRELEYLYTDSSGAIFMD